MSVYGLGLGAALLLAVGFVVQQHVAAETNVSHRLSPFLLLTLLRRPMWLAGIAAMAAGQALGAAALGEGSLTVIEPLLASNLLFALPLAAAWRRSRPGRREYMGAAMLIVGLAAFVAAAGPSRIQNGPVASSSWVLSGVAILGVVVLLVVVAKRSDAVTEATLLAVAAGSTFGLQDALTERSLLLLDHGLRAMLTSWQPYALITVAIIGLALGQNAFSVAPLPASLPAVTISEPLCGIALGAGLFSEQVRLTPVALVFEALGLAMMVIGVIIVGRSPVITASASSPVETET